MRSAIIAVAFVSLVAGPVLAQGRGRGPGVPPGHLPAPGQCRVWYDGRPPGHQPPPTSCREAERIAARDRAARVIYGAEAERRRDGDWRDREGRDDGRVIRRAPYPGDDRYPDSTRYPRGVEASVPYDTGYRDGYEKGREDARDNDSYDPVRHAWYRSADRGYNSRYGSREDYRNVYRDGFRAGYEDGYRTDERNGGGEPGGIRLPWPF